MTRMTTKPSLLVVSPGGLGSHYHGPAISLFRLLSGLRDRLVVDVVHGCDEQAGLEPLQGRAIRTGTKRDSLTGSVSFMLFACAHVLRHRNNYDAVLLVSLNVLTLVPGAIAHLCGLRVIARAAAIAEVSTDTGGDLGRRIKQSLMRRVTAYLAISEGIEAALVKQLGSSVPVHRIPNSVDTVRFQPVDRPLSRAIRADLGLADAPGLWLVCVGALGERKGQHLIVEALASLPHEVSLLLAGPAREPGSWERIQAIVEDRSLHGRIVHIPFLDDVERAYQASDLFVLPSCGEGMPNGMLEAMACGLVPIGTRVSGIEDLIDDDCGLFVTRDALSIANAVQRYAENPELLATQKAKARAKIEKSYGSQVIGNEVFDLLFDRPTPPAQ